MSNQLLKIGGRTYAVSIQTSEENSVFQEHDSAYGYIEYPTSQIHIRAELDVGFQKETLLHEILHGLLDNTGNEDINTDQLTKALAPRLHAFLIDNPGFQQYLLASEKSKCE